MPEDAGAYSSAKLREYVLGRVKSNDDLYEHAGLVEPDGRAEELLSFFEALELGREFDRPTDELRAVRMVRRSAATRHVGSSVQDVPAYAVGMTDQSVEISEAKALVRVATSILNELAPYVVTTFGATNRGKTGHMALWVELWRELLPMKYSRSDGVVVSNVDAPFVDVLVRSFPEWRRTIFGDREFVDTNGDRGQPPEIDADRPVWWFFDECSTHCDAHTHETRTAVEEKYLPMVKRFAKVRVDGCHIGHSTMDIHKDLRRKNIATEVVVKTGLTTAEVYEHATEAPAELKYVLEEIPESTLEYDPDDFSPWSWD